MAHRLGGTYNITRVVSVSRRYYGKGAGSKVLIWGKQERTYLGEKVAKTPVDISSRFGGTAFQQVSLGKAHSVLLTEDGRVITFGENKEGQLGIGTADKESRDPREVKGLEGVKIQSISAGLFHTLALASDGGVFSWGYGGTLLAGSGGLGHADRSNQLAPKHISVLADKKIVQVAAGGYHSLALTADGNVYSWGRGAQGRLGLGGFPTDKETPQLIESLENERIVQIAAGEDFSFAIADNGSVYSWGSDNHKTLGDGTAVPMESGISTPKRITSFERQQMNILPKHMSCGSHHCAMLDSKGEVYVWGKGYHFLPLHEKKLEGLHTVGLATGDHSVIFAVTQDGCVYGWGKKSLFGMSYVPIPAEKVSRVPALMTELQQKSADDVIWIAASDAHGMAIIRK